jgi:UDP-3-O-[3-hydroxymyristoyl] N-acetylglucosamine deacetylase
MKKSFHSIDRNSFLRCLHSTRNPFFCEEFLDIEQKTLARSIKFAGIGLHSGQACEMTIKPAPANTGLIFRHTSRNWESRAAWDRVVDNRLSTVLGDPNFAGIGVWRQNLARTVRICGAKSLGDVIKGVTFSTVEHVLAALSGADVDNAFIDVSSDEVPIMDGSALPFSKELAVPNVVVPIPRSKIKIFRILRRVEVVNPDGRMVAVEPICSENTTGEPVHDDLKISVEIDFGDRIQEGSGGLQRIEVWRKDFARDLAGARTFCFIEELEAMRAMRLAMGGSLDNAVVFSSGRALNPGGLRFADEAVRHKALDAVGDLRLGGRLVGHYTGVRPGHALNHRLLAKLFSPHAHAP